MQEKAALNQTFDHFELTLADDCSQDSSFQTATDYAANEWRVYLDVELES